MPILIELLWDEDVRVLNSAIACLRYHGQSAKGAVPLLVKHLRSKEDFLRRDSVITLAAIGPAADEAIPALESLAANDPHENIRLECLLALWEISHHKDIPKRLISLLRDPDASFDVQYYAARGLVRLRTSVKDLRPIIADLSEILRHHHNYPSGARARVAEILEEYGPIAEETLPLLRDALEAQDVHVRINAADAIWSVSKRTEPCIAVLLQELGNEGNNLIIKGTVIESLGRRGEMAKKAVPVLVETSEREHPYLKIAAKQAITLIEGRPHAQ